MLHAVKVFRAAVTCMWEGAGDATLQHMACHFALRQIEDKEDISVPALFEYLRGNYSRDPIIDLLPIADTHEHLGRCFLTLAGMLSCIADADFIVAFEELKHDR